MVGGGVLTVDVRSRSAPTRASDQLETIHIYIYMSGWRGFRRIRVSQGISSSVLQSLILQAKQNGLQT